MVLRFPKCTWSGNPDRVASALNEQSESKDGIDVTPPCADQSSDDIKVPRESFRSYSCLSLSRYCDVIPRSICAGPCEVKHTYSFELLQRCARSKQITTRSDKNMGK